MLFKDRDDGDYRIHAGSLELRAGEGFLGAVIVHRVRGGSGQQVEVYRDTEVSAGHRWSTADQAVEHALLLGALAVSDVRNRAARGEAELEASSDAD